MKKTAKEVRQAVAHIIAQSPHFTNPQDAANTERLRQRLAEFVEDGFLGFSLTLGNDWTIWSNSCTLNISQHCEPSITWSSTSRSPAMARVAARLYLEACDIADQIQAVLDCTTIKEEKK